MKPWDDIVLTEQEKEAAILEGKKKKWFHERNKAYWGKLDKPVGPKARILREGETHSV